MNHTNHHVLHIISCHQNTRNVTSSFQNAKGLRNVASAHQSPKAMVPSSVQVNACRLRRPLLLDRDASQAPIVHRTHSAELKRQGYVQFTPLVARGRASEGVASTIHARRGGQQRVGAVGST